MLPPNNDPKNWPQALPEIREDLQFVGRTSNIGGSPAWLIFDPIRHRYYRVDQRSFQLLSIWNRYLDGKRLAAAGLDIFGQDPDPAFVQQLVEFAYLNQLAADAPDGDWRQLNARRLRRQRSWLAWLIHNYLFVRIPLLRPDGFLQATLPIVAPFLSRTALLISFCLGTIGLYFVSRQWDQFLGTFSDFFSVQGLALYAFALLAIKVVHEFSHAYTAAKFGCRVPTMGVAFLVLFPVLYTDASDAWKLSSRRKRFLIGAAGIIAELALAAVATFLWVFLPDGTAKSIAFVVGTISWTFSIVINLNPFLRFDGYYLMSDLVGVDNLQERSFSLGRWALREFLFGLGEPAPQSFRPGVRWSLCVYAWATWIYRAVLFIGIALLVYFMFFKLLGIFLFVVEIIWFIARPIWSELRAWWKMKKQILSSSRSWASAIVVAIVVAALVLPISTKVTIPVVYEAALTERIFVSSPARLVQSNVAAGQQVHDGDVLFVFDSPKIRQDVELTKLRIESISHRLARASLTTPDRSKVQVLIKQREALENELTGLNAKLRQLTIRAPFDGRIRDLQPNLHNGRWLNEQDPLANLVAGPWAVVRGYVSEPDLDRIDIGNQGEFVPENHLLEVIPVEVAKLDTADVDNVDLPYLASTYGAGVAVRKTHNGQLVPVVAHYRIRLRPLDKSMNFGQVTRGVVRLSAKPESIIKSVWRQTLKVLVREAGA